MIKAGLIGAGIGFVYVMALTLLSPLCTLCLTPLLGVAVGYITGSFDKPVRPEVAVSKGTIAGGIAGAGVVLGQILAALVNGVLVTNSQELPLLMREFGLSETLIINGADYWQTTLAFNSVCSMFNLALIVGLGAVGGVMWLQRHKNRASLSNAGMR
jgi:hypothetical protein